MTVFEHLASILVTYGRTYYGIGKDIDEFKETSTGGNKEFYITWNGETTDSFLSEGKIGDSVENVIVYFKLPATDRVGNTSSQVNLTDIYNVRNRIEEYNTYSDTSGTTVKKTLSIESITPIESDLQNIIEFNLSLY